MINELKMFTVQVSRMRKEKEGDSCPFGTPPRHIVVQEVVRHQDTPTFCVPVISTVMPSYFVRFIVPLPSYRFKRPGIRPKID